VVWCDGARGGSGAVGVATLMVVCVAASCMPWPMLAWLQQRAATGTRPERTALTFCCRASTSLQYSTGAAHITFLVNTPPATAGSSATTSDRSAFLPAARREAYTPVVGWFAHTCTGRTGSDRQQRSFADATCSSCWWAVASAGAHPWP
jgi:hypothetical protein